MSKILPSASQYAAMTPEDRKKFTNEERMEILKGEEG